MTFETMLWATVTILGCGAIMTFTARRWGEGPSKGLVVQSMLLGIGCCVVFMVALGAMGADPDGVSAGSIGLLVISGGLAVNGKRAVLAKVSDRAPARPSETT